VNGFHDKKDAAGKVIIFANPCTMQIVLLHFGEVSLKNQGKHTNSQVIEQLTGISNYKAKQMQIEEMCRKIYRRSYEDMKTRVQEHFDADTVPSSTNFWKFLIRFENSDTVWIEEIKRYLD